MRRRTALPAIAIGLACGALGAAFAGDDRRSAGSGIPIDPPLPRHDRLADGRFSPGVSHLVVDRDSVQLSVRAAGGTGEPGWAVRTFTGERRNLKKPARTLDHPAWRLRVGCAEIVRTYRGLQGWLYPERRFRAASPGTLDRLGNCASTRRARALTQLLTTAAPDRRGEWVPGETVIWGIAPAGARAAVVEGLPPGPRDVSIGPRGAFLLALGEIEPARGTRIVFELAGGRRLRQRVSRSARAVPSLRGPVPGTETIEAVAPDPAGGPATGILVARRGDGGICIGGSAQRVGDRFGIVETSLGIVSEAPLRRSDCRRRGVRPSRRLPVVSTLGWGSGPTDQADLWLRRARIERRLQHGRFTIAATCHPDVEQVTIRTSRELRTLVPSPRAHAILAIYDGLPAGDVVITARLRGGRTWTERIRGLF